jgi:HSP20 family protein
MNTKDLIPNLFKGKKDIPVRRENYLSKLSNFGQDIDNLFEEMFRDFANDSLLPRLLGGDTQLNILPKIDISETDNEYIIEADIPGVKEEDLDISITKEGLLSIKGKRESKEEEKKRNYHRIERSYGSFERSLYLPENCNLDKVNASFKDGMTTIKVYKKEPDEHSTKKIKINK